MSTKEHKRLKLASPTDLFIEIDKQNSKYEKFLSKNILFPDAKISSKTPNKVKKNHYMFNMRTPNLNGKK